MRDPSPRHGAERPGFAARLDRAAQDINAFLLVLALGLAALDFSCFMAIKLRDAVPPVQRIDTAARSPELGIAAGFAAVPATRPAPSWR